MTAEKNIVWFRRDLRLRDNPALAAAAKRGEVIPLFIFSPEDEAPWGPGAASRWWLHHSLAELNRSLRKKGGELLIRCGRPADILPALAAECGATAVFWNTLFEPPLFRRDQKLRETLESQSVSVHAFNGSLLFDPRDVRNRQGGPFRVFTPFWRHCLSLGEIDDPVSAPRNPTFSSPDGSPALDELGLLPAVDWASGFDAVWTPGEKGARSGLRRFADSAVGRYGEDRDRPDLAGTSRLSPHLHFGEVSPRQVWHAMQERSAEAGDSGFVKNTEAYLRQLGWREFAHHLLWHFPDTPEQPLSEKFSLFPWQQDRAAFRAWRRGRTGYPIVDAGMRELWATGWMHNRVRMIAASFLVKDLLIPWQEGARWFWDTLVDADLANNTLGWQWVAGCGADASPWFRIFNPVTQGEKFDPSGDYIRRWVPEIAGLPDRWLNRPWEAPPEVLAECGVELGKTYPPPIIDHAEARNFALTAYETIK